MAGAGAALALGIYGLFGFHFLLFLALRLAPPVEANLVNYLWPLLIVVLAPVFLPGVTLRAGHVAAALPASPARRSSPPSGSPGLGAGTEAAQCSATPGARLGPHLGDLFARDAPVRPAPDRGNRAVCAVSGLASLLPRLVRGAVVG